MLDIYFFTENMLDSVLFNYLVIGHAVLFYLSLLHYILVYSILFSSAPPQRYSMTRGAHAQFLAREERKNVAFEVSPSDEALLAF